MGGWFGLAWAGCAYLHVYACMYVRQHIHTPTQQPQHALTHPTTNNNPHSSLAGGRDSEVCVVLEDTEPSDCTPSAAPTMDGKPFPQAG